MPTPNSDILLVPVNPTDEAAQKRSRRILGASLGATLVTVLILLAAMALAPEEASASNTCTLTNTSTSGPVNWNDGTNWTCSVAGSYPGQTTVGDTATIPSGGQAITVATFVNPVIGTFGASVQVTAGGTLTLETSSTATSGNTFTVMPGGTMGTESGANITSFQGNVTVDGGTFNSLGTIQLSGGQFTFNSGALTGNGTISAGSAQFAGTGPMSISGTTFEDSFFLTYPSSATIALALSGGATVNVLTGAIFDIQTDLAITGSSSETIHISSGGTLQKSAGSSATVISCFVKNDGTVAVSSAGGTGGFEFSGTGTHSGSFVTGSSQQPASPSGSHVFNSGLIVIGSSQPIVFSGTNTFNLGTSFSGGSPIEIAGGTQTFNATVTAGIGGLTWRGGTIAGTGPLVIPSSSSLVFDGSVSAMTLTGVIQSAAAMTYAPSNINNLLTINGSSAMLETTTPGSLSIAGDYDILASPVGAGMLRISGSANVTKTGGTIGSTIQAFVDNAGSTIANSSSGPLALAGGGQSTGSVIVLSSVNTINFTGETFNSNGLFSGGGTINVAGGTLNVNNVTMFFGTNLVVSSGTLGGTGNLTLFSPVTWAGGTITGAGSFTVSPPTGSLKLSGASGAMTLDGRTITNDSLITYNSPVNNLLLKNGASILNTGTITVASAGGRIDTDVSPTSITNNNAFNKTSASGTFVVKPTFNHAGNGSTITGGELELEGGGTSSASFTMAPGAQLTFSTALTKTYTWTTGAAFSGGLVAIKGPGTVATNVALTISNTSLEVDGGTFATAATLTVTAPGTFAWKGGTLSGAGPTVISAATTFDMTTELASRSATGHVVDNNGNAALVAVTQPPSLNDGSTFNNNGGATLDIQSDGSIGTNANLTNTFNNSGTLKKSAGGSGFRFDVPYNQTAGITDANSASSGSTVIFNAGGTLSGGTLQATQATNNVDFFGGTFNLNGGTLNGPGPIRITGGIVQVNTPLSATNFAQNAGTLQGPSDLTISSGGTFTWGGGTMASATGQLVILGPSGTLNVTGTSPTPLVLNSHTINNSGTITYHPLGGGQGNQLTFQGTGSIVNQSGALLNVTDNSSFLQSGGSTTIVNAGTIQTSGSSSIASTITNNATGLIKPTGGMLSLLSGTSNGILDAVSPGAINFGGGSTFTITGGTWGGSGGGFWVTGGDVTFSGNFSVSDLAFNSGQIDGSATLTLTGANAWGGGPMAGAGTTINIGTLTMSNNGNSFLDSRTFTNNGTVNYQAGGGSLQLKNGAAFNNAGLFDIQGDVNLTCNCATPGLFHNIGTGTLQKSAGSGTAVITAPFNNDGSVSSSLGTLQFAALGTHNGSFSAGSTSTISFTSTNTFNAPSTITGAGNISFPSGSDTINSGTVTPATLTVSGATVTLNSAATVGTLKVHNASILNGTGPITINGIGPLSEWSGGTIGGSGTLTINASSQMQIDGLTGAMALNTRPLVNNGTLNYNATSNNLLLTNAVLTNAASGTFNVDDTVGIGSIGTTSISNAGTMQRSIAGTEIMNPPATNTGTINANAGQLDFNGGLSQSAGSMNLLGGSIFCPSTISLAGGTLTGNGSVFAALNNSGGTVAPGTPATAGTIALSLGYSQGAGGSLNLKLGGISPGASYDVFDVGASNASLAGNLNVTIFNGFTPTSGNTFDVFKFGSRAGDFTNYNLPTFAGGGSFQSAYVSGSPNVLRLTAVTTASDLLITQTPPPSLLHNQNGTWTLTVTNGPTPVTNVVVTDTFANATFVSATSPGTCTGSGPVTCNIGSLSANQSVNVSLILNASTLATISNSASVTATEFDPNPANNNTGSAFTSVFPAADLTISNTASGNPVNAGSPLSFSLIVNNAGPDTTSGTITVSNTVPSGVTAATGSGTGWTCGALSGSLITCTSTTAIPSSSSSLPVVISMTAPASGPAVDNASVSASTADPNTGNNSAPQSVTITPRADVSITKNTSSLGIAGQSMVYTVVVTNNGPSSAAAVSVTDPTPTGLTFVSNDGGCTSAYPCSLTLTNGQSVTITSTYTIASSAAGSVVTNTAAVSSTTSDPTTGNNTAVKTTSITGSADLTITKSGPASSTPGSTLTYTITVTNNGPSDALAVAVNDTTPANTTFGSNTGDCTTAFPCAFGTMTAGQSKTFTSTFTVSPSFTGTIISNTATVSSSTSDPALTNNSSTATTGFGTVADLAVTKTGPASATTGSTVTYTLTVINNGPATANNVVLTDPAPAGLSFVSTLGGCNAGFPCILGNFTSGQSVTFTASYTITATSDSVTNLAQVGGSTVDSTPGNDSATVTTVIDAPCGQQPPSLIAPANGSTIDSPVTFSWSAVPGATSYNLFASVGGASTQQIGTTSATTLTLPISNGTVSWSVQAVGVPNCGQLSSAIGTFNVCSTDVPVIAVVGTNTTGQSYTVQWTAITGITNYELQEASTAAFDNAQTFSVTGTSKAFTKTATVPTPFFYRVRALGGCQTAGPFSASERVVIVPIPPINTQDVSATVDINNKKVVIQTVFIPGQGSAIAFIATTDEPWLTVSPASGILPVAGLTLTVSADPADLPNGTFTATIIITFPGAPGKVGALDTKPPVTVPVSISVVTPVSPASLSAPSANSLIIPSVGHLDGINSQWRSDVRITNTAPQKINYLLRFTPAGGDSSQIKQTQISIASGDTTALDDIVKNWYGVGALGDAANGVLEVRPLNTSGKGAPNAEDVNVSFVTVASSRTFNQSAGGTLGQYIPAIPFANFVGKVSGDARTGILSMQQISQSSAYRTNLGIVEASGQPASVLVSVFDTAGKNLLNLPLDLKAGEQQQLNSFLETKNITLTDGRIEVKVTGGNGKVMAYASVIDNKTSDPLLVTGVPLAQTAARSFVLPGVADLSTGGANWRTDLRVFNSGADSQYVTMTLYPQTGSASNDPISRSVSVNPGEVTILDNILASKFGLTNVGGALHVDTLADANLVVTGRTYNQVDGGGTYGQFIAATTPADAVGKGGRTLNVLQVEDSTRYRTNLGIAEVSGKPATVEVSVFLPDAKVAPKVSIPLAANEYRQFRVLQQLGVGTAYNARISIRVVDGDGRIAAYGSVIDMQTQDPTYVPAQ
jgi:conserved repeat domain/conserved repeat domain/conserved repeat domain